VAAAHPTAADVVMAVAIAVVSVLQGFDVVPGPLRPFDGVAVVLTLLATLPVALRRRAPTTALLTCMGFWCLLPVAGYPPAHGTYGILVGLYTVASTRPWRHVLACAALCCAGWVAGGVLGGQTPVVTLLAQGAVVPAVVWWFGDVARRLAVANRRLAAAGTELARRAVAEERVRLARELHDVVAHHLSVIAVQAGLSRYVLRSDPGTADAALGTVLDTGREALRELRRVLELLRVEGPAEDFAPAPGLAGLSELADRVRAAGVAVDLVVTGTPRPLAPGLELCAYRVVQESLTNVLKHARAASVAVTVDHADGELRVTVVDDGAGAARVTARAGNGLRGMRERAMLYGGSLRAGPGASGDGFEVQLVLPVPP
jgi:signal transduction histidine kinase